MKTIISAGNPFGMTRHGFLWEKLNERPKGKHLDYGTFDAGTLIKLMESRVIEEGYGVDVNKSAINCGVRKMPERIFLKVIEKGSNLPFEDESFDSASIMDVLEHIHDQKSVLMELHRVLKRNGTIIVTVPQKHIFSFLDVGNFKFIFPRLHRFVYELKYSKEDYHRRYVKCENGLFGDIEVEKSWHQHFSRDELKAVLMDCGFGDIQFDGSAFFQRPMLLIRLVLPFMTPTINKLGRLDARKFEKTNLFCVATKK
jgi:ubiquinone/menaquinone biosynthesis C-methylase UbiE